MTPPYRPTALALSLAALGGCAVSGTPDYDAVFGDASRQWVAQQTLDPAAAERNRGRAPPTDGSTVRDAVNLYVQTFRVPPTPPVINIGVGSTGSSGSGQ